MVLSPPILALLVCSTVVCGLTISAAAVGLSAVIGWDHQSSSRRQLLRERRWFLVETSLRLILALQLVSLLMFVATADHLKTLFTGAMCAVGSLNASAFGVPALTVKSAAFVLCGLWLVTDHASSAAASTGLVRFKVAFLVGLAGLLLADSALQIRYFADLDPEIITSCCATVFDPDAGGVGAELASLPVGGSRLVFFGGLAVTLTAGTWTVSRRRSTLVYSILAVALGLITTASVVSWIAPAYYELPTHHCPLCLLASDQGFVGYPLYLFLAIAVIAGAGSGLVRALRSIDVYRCIRVNEERRLCAVSMVSFSALAVISVWPLVTSPFRLEGL
jgi:hypothetical protein